MTELDRALVRRKLATIADNLADLEPIGRLSADAYRTDRLRRKAAERLLQELIEAAVDTNLHILSTLGAPLPEDYYSSFIALGEQKVIAAELASRLAPAAGLRNRLVHEYEEIDNRIVLQAIAKARRDFGEYLAQVEQYVRPTR